METYLIENVNYFTQRDNQYIDPTSKRNVASVSCFPTSLAMCIDYCLLNGGYDKSSVGCAEDRQLEDYINSLIDDSETKQWMIENQGRIGLWIWKYTKRTIYAIEAYIFNRLMNNLGYKAEEKYNWTYDTVCHALEQNEMPMVIGGNFSSVSSVGGHMNCLVGYNAIGLKEFIVHDPYGNAMTKYVDQNGSYVRYPAKFYVKDGQYYYVLAVSKI